MTANAAASARARLCTITQSIASPAPTIATLAKSFLNGSGVTAGSASTRKGRPLSNSSMGTCSSADLGSTRSKAYPTIPSVERIMVSSPSPARIRLAMLLDESTAVSAHPHAESAATRLFVSRVPEAFGSDVTLRNRESHHVPHRVCARCVPRDFGFLMEAFKCLKLLVEPRGIEPLTSAVRLQRSPI